MATLSLEVTVMVLVLISTVLATDGDKVQQTVIKPAQVHRTQLKVSRSLNPDDMETINVRSNNGGVATIIVKKRDGKSTNIPPQSTSSETGLTREEARRRYYTSASHTTILRKVSKIPTSQESTNQSKWTTAPRSDLLLKSGTYRFSQPTTVQEEGKMNMINSFIQHVGTMDPPTAGPTDVSRNNDRGAVHISILNTKNLNKSRKVPTPVFISSDPVYVKDSANKSKRGRSMIEVDADGISVIHGIRMPDDEIDKVKTWRNARVINGELQPYEKGYKPPQADVFEIGQLVYAKVSDGDEERRRSIGPFSTSDNYYKNTDIDTKLKSIGPFTVKDNLKNDPKVYHFRNKFQSEKSNRPIPSRGIGPFTVTDNSRVANSKLIEYIKRINEHEQRRDYFAGKAIKFSGDNIQGDTHSIQRRMLTSQRNTIFPISQMYMPKNKSSESDRSPVLEYAHPEFGVQAAKSVPIKDKPVKVNYYTKDIHSDRSPYAIEPAMNTDYYYENERNGRYGQGDGSYFHGKPATYPYTYGYLRKVKEQPFWMKITEQMRNTFQNGFSTVQQMTKPVFDPLVEAGQKISQNLGLSKSNLEAQDKVGIVAGPVGMSGSAFLPALGLMASGAALSIGALAMGRFLDVNLLKRSEDGSPIMEHKGEFRNLGLTNDGYYVLMKEVPVQEDQTGVRRETIHNVQKRSAGGEESLGSLLQSIESELPSRSRNRFEVQIRETNWSNPQCAKKVFCEVMTKQKPDDIILMEKKMETLLKMMHPNLGVNLSTHLSEVTDAIRRRDCNSFTC